MTEARATRKARAGNRRPGESPASPGHASFRFAPRARRCTAPCRRQFPIGSHSVSHSLHVFSPPRIPSFFAAGPRPGTGGNSMGSGWGLIGNSDPSGSTPRTEEVSAIHWFAASRSPKARAGLPPATGSGSPAEGPRHHRRHGEGREPDERAHGPEPGHLTRRRA